MERLGYAILEYTESEMVESGDKIVVLLWENADSTAFSLYLRHDWKTLIGPASVWDRQYIQDFIFDLHQLRFKDPNAVEEFFTGIQGLGVGPLRTSLSGSAEVSPAERRRLHMDRQVREVVPCRREWLSDLIAVLTQPSNLTKEAM